MLKIALSEGEGWLNFGVIENGFTLILKPVFHLRDINFPTAPYHRCVGAPSPPERAGGEAPSVILIFQLLHKHCSVEAPSPQKMPLANSLLLLEKVAEGRMRLGGGLMAQRAASG
jgi:hypothetical protein